MKTLCALILCACLISVGYPRTFHHPEAFMQDLKKEKEQGKKIYAQFCANCHDKKPLINIGAPRIGEHSDWTPRLKKPFKDIMKIVNEGVGAMPQRGGCFECSDTMLKKAVLYMLPNEKQIKK